MDPMKRSIERDSSHRLIDYLGLALIGAASLGYILFDSSFAELHIALPFLDFPIFIGEIFLFLCLVLFLVKYGVSPKHISKKQYLVAGYFIFIILEALYGYVQWGPLAFRNAALFYYPAFIVFGYSFFTRKAFRKRICLLLFVLILGIFTTRVFYTYWVLSCFLAGWLLLLQLSPVNRRLRWLSGLALFLCTPYTMFFNTSRMMMVANVVSAAFLGYAFYIILNVSRKVKLVGIGIGICLIAFGLYRFADRGKLKSLAAFRDVRDSYRDYNAVVKRKINSFKLVARPDIKLYNPYNQESWKARLKLGSSQDAIEQDNVHPSLPETITLSGGVEEGKKTTVRPLDFATRNARGLVAWPRELGLLSQTEEASAGSDDYVERGTVPVAGKRALLAGLRESRILSKVGKASIGSDYMGGVIASVEEEQAFLAEPPESGILPEMEEGANVENNHAMVSVVPVAGERDLGMEPGETEAPRDREKALVESSYNVACGNAVFRLFIWRDMFAELIQKRAVFGFDFGKPLRSVSLEILNWGDSAWRPDGWVAAHNSYFHIIYRTGIIGVALIFIIFSVLVRMIKGFIQCKSVAGILLCGIIINWFVAANFLLIFELPYTAIPIWSLFGMTLAYAEKGNHGLEQ